MALASISDYSAAISVPQMIKADVLKGGYPVKKNNRMIKYSGGFCVVYPFETINHKYAVRCWHADVSDMQTRTRKISEAISATGLPYFAKFEYVPNGIQTSVGIQPLVIMDWIDAMPIKKYIAANIDRPSKIGDLAERFKSMVADLHTKNFSHGDLQHGNIMVRADGSLMLVDYDSMYVPGLDGCKDEIKGLVGYQHPARWRNETLSPKADYFSELVIYTSLKALEKSPELWKQLKMEDTDTMLFSSDDIASKGSSEIFHTLSTFKELSILSERIKESLRQSDINDLLPLEDALKDPVKEVVGKDAIVWNTLPNEHSHRKVEAEKNIRETTNRTQEKWNNPVEDNRVERITSKISGKWKTKK